MVPIHIQNSVILALRVNFKWIRKDGIGEKGWFCCSRDLYSKMGKAQLPKSKIIINPPDFVKKLNPAKIFLVFAITVSQVEKNLSY